MSPKKQEKKKTTAPPKPEQTSGQEAAPEVPPPPTPEDSALAEIAEHQNQPQDPSLDEQQLREQPTQGWRKIVFEDIVITCAIVVGIVGGGLMSMFLNPHPIIVGIFISMGVSSLIYRFLGGISQDTTITVKGIKLTGTVAVWIALAFLINNELIKQNKIQENLMMGKKTCVLTVREGNRLANNVEITVGEEEIPISPVKEDDGAPIGKFKIPLKKLKDEGFIFINKKSETSRDKSYTLKYNHTIPKITVYIDDDN